MAEESFIDNDLLISLVEQRPVLWDKTMDLYKNRVATKMAWKEIMITLNPSFESKKEKQRKVYANLIIKRWTHLRDNYNRSLKKMELQKWSGLCKPVKPYVYSKQLSFLQKVKQYSEIVSNVIIENNTESDNQENNSEVNEASETNSMQTNDTIVTMSPITKRMPKRPPMEHEASPLDGKMVKFVDPFLNNEPTTTNRHLSFFNGILPSLDQFDEDEVLEFQIEVLQLLKKIKNNRRLRVAAF